MLCSVTGGRRGPGWWGSGRAAVGSSEGAEGSLPTAFITSGSPGGRPEQYTPGGPPPLLAQSSVLHRQSYTQPLASHIYPNLRKHQAQHVQHSTCLRASTLKVPYSRYSLPQHVALAHTHHPKPSLPHVCTHNQ